MRKFFQKIVDSPEPVRRRFFVIFLVLSLPLVLGAWVVSFKLTFRHVSQVGAGEVPELSNFWNDFETGFQNTKELLADLNIQLPSFWEERSFELRPEPERPRIHLPLE